MTALFFVMAILLMVVGHVFKTRRWGLYISVYEEPQYGNLLGALSVGHVINAVLPVRIGDLFRIGISGKKLNNGYPFAIATVITDLYVDVITVGLMFYGLSLIGKGGERLVVVANAYMLLFLIIFPLTIIAILAKKYIKRFIAFCAQIFNENIEFSLLYTSYLTIASMKDILKKISKKKFLLYTILMWLGYVSSYVIFAETLKFWNFSYTTSEVFAVLFAGSCLYKIEASSIWIWATYLIAPLVACYVFSRFIIKKEGNEAKNVLPQINQSDRLAFLRTYYSDENREHVKAYLEINNDATVVEDNSAGSNASTVVILKDEKLYFRKYAFDADGEKLAEQIDWIENHQKDIPLPAISAKRVESNYATYDMPSMSSAVGLFRYIHTMPALKGWSVLEKALDDIREGLHSKNTRPCDKDTINKYIDSKVDKNLKIIREADKYIVNLEKNDTIFVNGKKYKTLKFYKSMFEHEHMASIFANDTYSDVHGDLTIENIVCLGNPDEINKDDFKDKIVPFDYYFIDPNTGNVHDSPFLDYGKLLQSLHGNYEFLMMVNKVNVTKNSVNYMMTKSEAYGIVYGQFKNYLLNNFTKEQVLSIYYHEIIHWLRLMPYKIRKDEKIAVVFYTGLLQVLADVWDMENS